MTVGNIVKSKPPMIVSVHKDQTIADAVGCMREKNVSGLFVVDDSGELVGLFTERDVVRCVLAEMFFEETAVSSVIRTDITTFHPSTEIGAAIAVASKKNIRHLPVVEAGTIVGMITFRDLVSYLLPDICYMANEVY